MVTYTTPRAAALAAVQQLGANAPITALMDLAWELYDAPFDEDRNAELSKQVLSLLE